MEVEFLDTQDQFLVCLLVLIILSFSKTGSSLRPPELLRKQEEAGKDKHTNINRLFLHSPCVSNVRLLWLVHIFTEECLSSGRIRGNTCPESCVVPGHLSAPLPYSPLQPAHPLSSSLSPLFAFPPIHIAALRPLLQFLTVYISSSAP